MMDLFHRTPEVEEVILFGSRATGRHGQGSDVDLALKGRNLTSGILSRLREFLNEETNMPYRFDLFLYSDIDNKDLVDHINRVGVLFYSRSNVSIAQDPEDPYSSLL